MQPANISNKPDSIGGTLNLENPTPSPKKPDVASRASRHMIDLGNALRVAPSDRDPKAPWTGQLLSTVKHFAPAITEPFELPAALEHLDEERAKICRDQNGRMWDYHDIEVDPTGLFGEAPSDSGIPAMIQAVLQAHESGIRSYAAQRLNLFRTSDNQLTPYTDADFFVQLVKAIESSETFVLIAVSQFSNDFAGRAIVDALVRRIEQRPHLTVHIIADVEASASLFSTNSRENLERIAYRDKKDLGAWAQTLSDYRKHYLSDSGDGAVKGPVGIIKNLLDATCEYICPTKERISDNIRIYHNVPVLGIEHRKTIVIDGQKAFLGGTAFADLYYANQKVSATYRQSLKNGQTLPPHKDHNALPEMEGYPHWHDLQVQIQGSAVKQVTASLLMSIMHHGGDIASQAVVDGATDKEQTLKNIARFWFPAPQNPGTTTMRIGQTIPLTRNETLASAKSLIDHAKNHVYLHVAYLTCPEFHQTLTNAVKRGVHIHLGVPGGWDVALYHYAYRSGLQKLYRYAAHPEQIEARELRKDDAKDHSGYNHDKFIVVDDAYCWVATGNPEPFTKFFANDTCFTTHSPEFAKQLLAIYRYDADNSDRISLDQLLGMSDKEKAGSILAGVFFRLLDYVKNLRLPGIF